MIDDRGRRIDNDDSVERVLRIGAVVVELGPVESVDVFTWCRQLRSAGMTHGIRICANLLGSRVLVHNPDYVGAADPRRTVLTAVPDLPTSDAATVRCEDGGDVSGARWRGARRRRKAAR